MVSIAKKREQKFIRFVLFFFLSFFPLVSTFLSRCCCCCLCFRRRFLSKLDAFATATNDDDIVDRLDDDDDTDNALCKGLRVIMFRCVAGGGDDGNVGDETDGYVRKLLQEIYNATTAAI